MQYKTTKQFWTQCLCHITNGKLGAYIENPAMLFANDVKSGKYDNLSGAEYDRLLKEVEQLSPLWNDLPQRTVSELLLSAVERITIPPKQTNQIVNLLTDWYTQAKPESSTEDSFVDFSETELETLLASAFAPRAPKAIRDAITESVIGQKDAVKAAAMITYNHLAGRRSTAVFCGPSGCGKTEIWRCLSKQYPGLIRIMDFSRFSADGWKGSLHLRDIFEGVKPDDIERHGLIVVLDEADKILCEHAIGAGGTDYNAIVQNSLLKMLDGDVIEFGAQDGKNALSVDCSKVSVVMLGAFERLLEGKASDKHIGFGAVSPKADAGSHRDISYEDLIDAGMRREVAGRIRKIVALDAITANNYKAILKGPVLAGLEKFTESRIHIDDAAADAITAQAIKSGLGVRWMRSALMNAIDDAMFDSPEADNFVITIQDGKLYCQARGFREVKPVESCVVYYEPEI